MNIYQVLLITTSLMVAMFNLKAFLNPDNFDAFYNMLGAITAAVLAIIVAGEKVLIRAFKAFNNVKEEAAADEDEEEQNLDIEKEHLNKSNK